MQLTDSITADVDRGGGRPGVCGMRIRVVDVLDLFAAGLSSEEILAEMPGPAMEDLLACLSLAAGKVDYPVVAAK